MIKISETEEAKLSGLVDDIIGDARRIPQFRAGRGRPERGCAGANLGPKSDEQRTDTEMEVASGHRVKNSLDRYDVEKDGIRRRPEKRKLTRVDPCILLSGPKESHV